MTLPPLSTRAIGQQFWYHATCNSTNHIAQQLIQNQQARHGAVVFSDEQTEGRGQHTNRWESAAGQNLTFSLVLYPDMPIEQQFYLTIIASLAVTDTLNRYVPEKFTIKWPNDILCESSKICGILIQNNLKDRKIHTTVVGIGLNINQIIFQAPRAASLALLTEKTHERTVILTSLLQHLESRYLQWQAGALSTLKADYLQRMHWRDKPHFFQDERGTFRGTILGIDATGRLALETEGEVRYYDAKQVKYQW